MTDISAHYAKYQKSSETENRLDLENPSAKRDVVMQAMPVGISPSVTTRKKRRSLLSSYKEEIEKQFSSLFDYVIVFPMEKVFANSELLL